MVSKIFTYVGTSFLIAFGFIGSLGVVFAIYTYFRDQNSKLIGKLEKDIATVEWSNDVRIRNLRSVSRVAMADRLAADMTRAKQQFCDDIRLGSHDDEIRLASYRSYFRQLADIAREMETAPPQAVQHSRLPSIPQRERIEPPKWTDQYGISAHREGVRAPAGAAITHSLTAVENMRPPISQIPAPEEGGTLPAVEATAQAPAAAEREDVDPAVAEQEDVYLATTGEPIDLTASRSTQSLDGDSAYFSMASSDTPTE